MAATTAGESSKLLRSGTRSLLHVICCGSTVACLPVTRRACAPDQPVSSLLMAAPPACMPATDAGRRARPRPLPSACRPVNDRRSLRLVAAVYVIFGAGGSVGCSLVEKMTCQPSFGGGAACKVVLVDHSDKKLQDLKQCLAAKQQEKRVAFYASIDARNLRQVRTQQQALERRGPYVLDGWPGASCCNLSGLLVYPSCGAHQANSRDSDDRLPACCPPPPAAAPRACTPPLPCPSLCFPRFRTSLTASSASTPTAASAELRHLLETSSAYVSSACAA